MTEALVVPARRAYRGIHAPNGSTAAMSAHRYRITVTPIEGDGQPCSGRCAIEFDQRSDENWMRQLETLQQQRDLGSDACAALMVGMQLLKGLPTQSLEAGSGPLAHAQADLQSLLARLCGTRQLH